MSHESRKTWGEERTPLFRSTQPRIGDYATVEIASNIQASGRLTEVVRDGMGTVDIGGRKVSGVLVPSFRRLDLPQAVTMSKDEGDENIPAC